MKKIISMLIITALAAVFVMACATAPEKSLKDRTVESTPDDYDPIHALIGDVEPEPMEDENEQASAVALMPQGSDEDAIGGTMGVFLPTAKINGEPVKATFSVKEATSDGNLIMENMPSGQEVELTPGTYDFIFKCSLIAGDSKFVLRDVDIPAGRRIKRDMKFKVGKITLTTGKRCRKSAIKIRKKGATNWIQGKFFTCKEIMLEAGEYEALRGKIPIAGIQVYDGGTRDILIRAGG